MEKSCKMSDVVKVSALPKTWLLDIDGTILKHNGYKIDGYDSFLSGAKEFLQSIPDEDMIIFITARTDEFMQQTIDFFQSNGIRYNQVIFNAPYGERILVNDCKPSGLNMSVAINTERDKFMAQRFVIDESL